MNFLPVLLVAHIGLAISLLAPNIIAPFVLRRSGGTPTGRVGRFVIWLQGPASPWIAGGVAVTGVGLIIALGINVADQPWLLAALAIYAVVLIVAAVYARPNLRALLGLSGTVDEATWQRRARTQRWIAYGMAAAIGVIGLLMSTKPDLW
jgi:hypothetical protein